MDNPHTIRYPDSASAVLQLGEALAAPGAGHGSPHCFALALSSAVALEPIGQALATAFARRAGLRERLHLFASDWCLDRDCGREGELRATLAHAGLHPTNLHLPVVAGDVLRTARAYEAQIRAFFRLAPAQAPAFDAVVLSPRELERPRCGGASERLATGVYDASTGRCSVCLTAASLARASAVYGFGPSAGEAGPPALPPALAARTRRLHWPADAPRASRPLPERAR